jgi:hypothetical protein
LALINLIAGKLLASAFMGGCAVVFVLRAIRPSKIGVVAIEFIKFFADSITMGSTRFGAQEGFL